MSKLSFRLFPAALLISSLSMAAVACGGDDGDDTPAIEPGCNPLGGISEISCLAPFPSAAYMVEDSTTATGFRLDFPEGSLATSDDGRKILPDYYHGFDGFSPNGPIVVSFVTGVSPTGLTGHDDLARSVTPQSSTILLDMETGEQVVHFAELDANSDDPLDQALIIRPMQRLEGGHRYAVAITKAVKAADGNELPIAPAFQALLDGKSFDHPLFQRLAPRYPEIFAKLEAAGVAKADLVLAWDYVTASDEFLIRDMVAMRDDAVTRIGDASGLTFDGESVDDFVRPEHTIRFLRGTYDAPSYLTNHEADDSIIARDAAGLPEFQGMERWNWAAVIPKCLETTPGPTRVMIFGHGLFGSAEDYMKGGLLQRVSNEFCVVVIAGDFIGLSNRNVATAAIAVNDINKGRGITEKLQQSVINFIALERLAKGPMIQSALFQVGGMPSIDPARIGYFGASLGGIMGGAYMAYSPDMMRGALGVPGCNWTVCFERSFAWPPLQIAMQGAYPGFVNDQEIIALMGMAFDRIDPSTTAATLTTAPITGVPAKQIFIYATLGDSLVSNIATDMMTRTMGLPVLSPSVHEPFGVTLSSESVSSGVVWFDEHATPLPSPQNLAPVIDNGTHADVHERAAALSMIEEFLENGTITMACAVGGTPAACDCATGACEAKLGQP